MLNIQSPEDFTHLLLGSDTGRNQRQAQLVFEYVKYSKS